MEYVSVLAGAPFTDHPRCTHPALATLARLVNDWIDDDGARSELARLAPDLDILGEIQKVHMEIATRHGRRLAEELGIDPAITAQFDLEAVKAAMGVPDVERLTYREVQERREIVRRRLEEKRRRA